MDGLDELLNASEACIVERLAPEDAEPDLDLVEPACAGGGEVESDVRMRRNVDAGRPCTKQSLAEALDAARAHP